MKEIDLVKWLDSEIIRTPRAWGWFVYYRILFKLYKFLYKEKYLEKLEKRGLLE